MSVTDLLEIGLATIVALPLIFLGLGIAGPAGAIGVAIILVILVIKLV